MVEAYSRLKRVLQEREMTVPESYRRIHQAGHQVNLKSLYRLSKEQEPLERLDLRVAGILCNLFRMPLSDLIEFAPPRVKLRRFPVVKQRRLDFLMGQNNEGRLNTAERKELRTLVREAEELTLHNARVLARQRERIVTATE